jgi:ABC-2 type transport system permease protein
VTRLSARRIVALIRHDLRLLRSDLMPHVTGLVTPLLLMALLKPVFDRLDTGSGGTGNGAVQAIPGLAVTYLFFLVGQIGMTVFREHGWNTWSRLRASPVSGLEMVAGRAVVPMLTAVVHLSVLLTVGSLAFRLPIRGSLVALALIGVALAACLVAYGFALVALIRTVMRFSAIANLSALLFGAIGGALIPGPLVPGWLRPLAPLTPTYWAMRGFRTVIVDGGGVPDVLAPVAALFLMAVLGAAVTGYRFRMSDTKVSWA